MPEESMTSDLAGRVENARAATKRLAAERE
jgi:hypothetical protein